MKNILRDTNHASTLIQQGRMQQAAQILDKILKKSSSYVPALVMRGALHFQSRQYQSAIHVFTKVLDIEPNNLGALENLGKAYVSVGRHDLAEKHYKSALEQNPDALHFAMGLANAHMNQGRLQESLQVLETYKNQIKSEPNLLLNIGLLNEKQGLNQEAIDAFREAISLAPKSPNGYLCLGRVFTNIDDHKTAEKYFSQAIELGADNPETRLSLAKALFKQGKEDLAGEHFYDLTRRAPDFQGAYVEFDNFLLFSGSAEKKKLIASLSKDRLYSDWHAPLGICAQLTETCTYSDKHAKRTLSDFWACYEPGKLHDRSWWAGQLEKFGPSSDGHDKILRGIHSAVFSWSLPDAETLAQIADFCGETKLHSYGAGSALWERLLRDHFGIEVVASDCNLRHRFLEVQIEDFSTANVIASETVFLSWIISGNTSVINILKNMHRGQRLILVGEPPPKNGQRGICASPAVFNYLKSHFRLEATQPLVNYSHMNDKISFYHKN